MQWRSARRRRNGRAPASAAPTDPATRAGHRAPPARAAGSADGDGAADRAVWDAAVAGVAPLEIRDIYRPRFAVTRAMTVATQGSCFAQHFGRQLLARGFTWLEAEPPVPFAPRRLNEAYGYGIFSFRTGNIYTTRLLRQWLEWAGGRADPPDEVWQQGQRFVDPFRPTIEPGGFPDADSVLAARAATLSAIAEALQRIDVFVFTLGQTEAWENARTGLVYPLCPGTSGGAFDPNAHRFVNYGYRACLADMERAIAILRAHNPAMTILLTVSPVPMVASASGEHVLAANGRTKAVLRAVAGHLRDTLPGVDYFPSYELIAEPPFRGIFYDPNMRTVCAAGVEFVMHRFFAAHGAPASDGDGRGKPTRRNGDDLVCEEVMLEAAGGR